MTRRQVLILVIAFLGLVGVFLGGIANRGRLEAVPHGLDAVFVRSAADVNKDFIVDVRDLGIVASQIGMTGENLKGDINKDGKVDAVDLGVVKWEITVINVVK